MDNALTTRSLEAAAELVGVTGRRERPGQGAVINSLGAKIGASNDGGPASELAGELLLQRAEGCLRVGFASLRRNLHDILAGCSTRRGGRREGALRWLRGPRLRRRSRG